MMEFTKTKFCSLSLKKQHKELAKLINEFYRMHLAGGNAKKTQDRYVTYSKWVEEKPTILWDCSQSLSDGYHFHLRLAGINDNENVCLPSVEHFDKTCAEDTWPICVYLDNLRSAHNVGSILRTVEGFSFSKVFFSEATPWIDNNQVQKTSRNAYLFVDCQKTDTYNALPKPLVALETAKDAIPLFQFVFPETFTLILGNEEYGCSNDTLQKADYIIKIPMRGRKNSLNVANAFAIVAAEILRQRTLR